MKFAVISAFVAAAQAADCPTALTFAAFSDDKCTKDVTEDADKTASAAVLKTWNAVADTVTLDGKCKNNKDETASTKVTCATDKVTVQAYTKKDCADADKDKATDYSTKCAKPDKDAKYYVTLKVAAAPESGDASSYLAVGASVALAFVASQF